MRCRIQMSRRAHPHALLYHYAAHAMVMAQYGIQIFSVRVHGVRRHGAIHADLPLRDGRENRRMVERDVAAICAGFEAQKYGCGHARPMADCWDDSGTTLKRLEPFTRDGAELSAWIQYLHERSRVTVMRWWGEIATVAHHLDQAHVMTGVDVSEILEDYRRNPFRGTVSPFRFPRREEHGTPTGGNVDQIWSRPTLSELLRVTQ